jgi:hypothetical protein
VLSMIADYLGSSNAFVVPKADAYSATSIGLPFSALYKQAPGA